MSLVVGEDESGDPHHPDQLLQINLEKVSIAPFRSDIPEGIG